MYVHHHGLGHLHRASTIAARLGEAVLGLSTLPAPADWPGPWQQLPDDAPSGTAPGLDPTGGGALHWAPLAHDGFSQRMALVAARLTDRQITTLVSDVSVEVALLGRLLGLRTVVMAQPGDRLDRTHRLAYDSASLVVAPWPERAPDWPPAWAAKTNWVGAISRFDGRPVEPGVAPRSGHHTGRGRRVLLLVGRGGIDLGPDDVRAAASATPSWQWRITGPLGPAVRAANVTDLGSHADVWGELLAADVVVTHAGQNSVAEVAAARRPAVVVPQTRPHDEQMETAGALRRADLAEVCQTWPSTGWGDILDAARRRDGGRWRAWSDGRGAERAARALQHLDT